MSSGRSEPRFDVAVIGAGVVGCAVARRFTLEGARVVVLEKAADVLDGASKGNSGLLHTGFDAPVGSLERRCIAAGYAEYVAIREALGLPLIETGALVLAWSDAEEAALPGLVEQAEANGVAVEMLTADAVRALEPELGPGVRAGFRVPGEHVIDPWSAPHAYLLQALLNGAELRRGAAVTGGSFDGTWRLETTGGPVTADAVVACAGLWGDRVDPLLLGQAPFTIRPRKGQFVVYDKPAAGLVRHILLPVPSATTKGIVVCRTAYGNVLVGPTAEEQDARDTAPLERAVLAELRRRGEALVPALAGVEVTAVYAGLRPATDAKDYQVHADPGRAYISLGGIRSTGLSAALGLARHAWDLYAGFGPAHTALPDPVVPKVPTIAEGAGPRDWTRPGNGGILCHCELVTRREVEAALDGPLAAGSFAGLKRRTRATMGRCQGFYCSAELTRLTAGRLPAADPAAPQSPRGIAES